MEEMTTEQQIEYLKIMVGKLQEQVATDAVIKAELATKVDILRTQLENKKEGE